MLMRGMRISYQFEVAVQFPGTFLLGSWREVDRQPLLVTRELSAVFWRRTRLRSRPSSKNTAQAVYLPQIGVLRTGETLEIYFLRLTRSKN